MSTQNQQPQTKPVEKYDPQKAYFQRQTPTAQANRAARANHQFADSIGGCSANYRY